jgi:hypothetical protein
VNVFLSLSRSMALFDPRAVDIDLPPICVFAIDDEHRFQPCTSRHMNVYGTDSLFCGLALRSVATRLLTGNYQPRVIANALAPPELLQQLSPSFLGEGKAGLHIPLPLTRESVDEFLIRNGVPVQLARQDLVHPSLITRYEASGPGG